MSLGSLSFITCVADPSRYDRCRASIASLDPTSLAVSVDTIQNLDNSFSAPAALNLAWERAPSDLLVFCHEDVVFPEDWTTRLLDSIDRIEETDEANWGTLGPIGRNGKRFAGFYADDITAVRYGPLPRPVETLDELCLIVRRELPLRFDERLGGFHLYGVDLAIQCLEAGLQNYAVDAFLFHHTESRGRFSRPPEYRRILRKLQRKWMWRRRRVGKSVGTTCGQIHFGVSHGWI